MDINQNNIFGNNNISFGKTQREVDEAFKSHLLGSISKNEKFKIFAALGDGEAIIFAESIKQFLISKGYEVDGVNQEITSPPAIGQFIYPASEDGYRIIRIGHQ